MGGNGIQGTAVSGKRFEGQEIKVNQGAGNMTVSDYIALQKKMGAGATLPRQAVGGEIHLQVTPLLIDEALYENRYIKVASVKGGFNSSSTTPWEIEASALEFNTSGSWTFIDVNTSYQALNLEGDFSYGNINDPGLSLSAKATALDFEGNVSINVFGYSINISPEVMIGGIGGEITATQNKLKFALEIGVGGGVGVSWDRVQK